MRGHLARETRRLLGRFSDPVVTGNMATQRISTYLTLQPSPMSKVSHGSRREKCKAIETIRLSFLASNGNQLSLNNKLGRFVFM